MADPKVIDAKEDVPQIFDNPEFVITKKGSVKISYPLKEGIYSPATAVAVQCTSGGIVTGTLNGNISLTDKRRESVDSEQFEYGLYFPSVTLAYINTDNAAKINVSVSHAVCDGTTYTAAGIYVGAGTLFFKTENFLDAVTVDCSDTAKYDKQSSGDSFVAYGIANVSSNIVFSGVFAAALKVTAKNNVGPVVAKGVSAAGDTSFKKGITKSITVTTTATPYLSTTEKTTASDAYAVFSSGSLTMGPNEKDGIAINAALSATATGKVVVDSHAAIIKGASAHATVLYAGKSIQIDGLIKKDITAKATANSGSFKYTVLGVKYYNTTGGTAYASCLDAANDITVEDALSGKIKSTATASANYAYAYGVLSSNGNVTFNDNVTKEISVTATGTGTGDSKSVTALAYGFSAAKKLAFQSLTGSVTVKATSSALVTAPFGIIGGVAGNAVAYGLNGVSSVTIAGSVAKVITVTATANSKSYTGSAGKTEAGGKAIAVAVNAGAFTVEESFKGVKVTATSKADTATAQGIKCTSLTMVNLGSISVSATSKTDEANAVGVDVGTGILNIMSDLGTLNVTASGDSDSEAIGIRAADVRYSGLYLSGKITVTCKTGEATGLSINSLAGTGTSHGLATLNITTTGKSSTAILFDSTATANALTLENSKITAKGGDSFTSPNAILDKSSSGQNITLDKCTLTGAVDLGQGDDVLEVENKTKITGDLDFGAGADSLTMHAGTQIKGSVSNLEDWNFLLDDTKNISNTMWEGSSYRAENIILDVDSDAFSTLKKGKSVTFSLMKTPTKTTWAGFTAKLKLDGELVTESLMINSSMPAGDYLVSLTYNKSSTLQVVVTKMV